MLSESDVLLRLLVEGLPRLAVVLLDVDGNVLQWNDGARAIKGYDAGEVVGRHFSQFYPKEEVAFGKPALALKLAAEHGRYEETGQRVRKDGTLFEAHAVVIPIYNEARKLKGFGKLTCDISAPVTAATGDTPLRPFLSAVLETMIDGLIVIDVAGKIRVFNKSCERIFGYKADEMIGRNIRELTPHPIREAHDGYLARYQQTGTRNLIGTSREFMGARKDGTRVPISLAIGEAKLGDETIFVGVVHDLTEKQAMEAELRQSQRLDAIGKLTGGVAHDFNNILMVITANVEALAEEVGVGSPMSGHLDRIMSSTQRAADLTRQLLAFARKQALTPKPTDLNNIVAATGKMLDRALGEDIDIEAVLADDLWITSVDRAQLESALVNLCINARDAMPGGGRLMIETRNVVLDEDYVLSHPDAAAGEYALLAITDSGKGIPPEVLERVFEPFFTTKEVGQGTGLGLSMVYGFIKQSNGHISIYSEVGHGTTVRMYLPRIDQPGAGQSLVAKEAPPRGNARILVVEDDRHVRESVVFQLESLGYVVGQAANSAEGLERMRQDARYDLLLTDVVMPGAMNGKAFADAATARDPQLRVLFMSGYSENALIHYGRLDAGIRLLTKPFRKIDLARAVRDALTAPMIQ